MLSNDIHCVLACLIKDGKKTLIVKIRTPLIGGSHWFNNRSMPILRRTIGHGVDVEVVIAERSNHGDLRNLPLGVHFLKIGSRQNWDDRALQIHPKPTRHRGSSVQCLIFQHPSAHHNDGDRQNNHSSFPVNALAHQPQTKGHNR